MTKLLARLAARGRDEKGQALILVLVFLLIGGLILPPVLSHISTTLKTGVGYQDKTDALYAADSGIDDAIWQIKYDRLGVIFDDPVYDIYDFGSTWSYELDQQINRLLPTITIENVWIPKDVPYPNPAEARDLVGSNKLLVAGTTIGESVYKIKIAFSPAEGEEDSLMVDSIGIWLPLGFTYNGSCNLADDLGSDKYIENVTDYAGGQAVVWDFTPPVAFTEFPGIETGSSPLISEITFNFTADQPESSPHAIAWTTTSGVSDVPLAWDIDTRIYRITSTAEDTEIEAYTAKCELRKMGAAIAGDYRAVGNSLMRDIDHDYYAIRDELIAESDAEITDIPATADVVAALLYWSGWYAEGTTLDLFSDDCSDFGEWISGSCWNINLGHFRSHYSSGTEATRYNTLKDSLDLTPYSGGTVQVSWDQWEEGYLEYSDALRFQFSSDGGWSWSNMFTAFNNDIGSNPRHFSYTIPEYYLTDNFKFRFYLADFTGYGEYCHVDNFAIYHMICNPDTSVVFKINGDLVYLDGEDNPQTGAGEIVAGESEILESGDPGQFSYACHADVTKLIKAYSDTGDNNNPTGNGYYTVGEVDGDTGYQLSYAGWSLIVIYSSPETAGHQLYLYDTFAYAEDYVDLDFDFDGEPGGSIAGFIIPEVIEGEADAARLTCFVGEGDDFITGDYLEFNGTKLSDGDGSIDNVWDSQSVGMSEDGVDIDTFHVTWASGLLEPGDTTSNIDIHTTQDNWNLIYIILSLRSETVTGGTTHYVIYGG